jgi:hypothetical protein
MFDIGDKVQVFLHNEEKLLFIEYGMIVKNVFGNRYKVIYQENGENKSIEVSENCISPFKPGS